MTTMLAFTAPIWLAMIVPVIEFALIDPIWLAEIVPVIFEAAIEAI